MRDTGMDPTWMPHSPNPPLLLASMFATTHRAFATKADEILLPRQNAINCCSANNPMRFEK
jgi:hypothetical protein